MKRLALAFAFVACTVGGVETEKDHPVIPNVGPSFAGGSQPGAGAQTDAGVPVTDATPAFDAGRPPLDTLQPLDGRAMPDALHP